MEESWPRGIWFEGTVRVVKSEKIEIMPDSGREQIDAQRGKGFDCPGSHISRLLYPCMATAGAGSNSPRFSLSLSFNTNFYHGLGE